MPEHHHDCQCPQCGGRFGVVNTKIVGENRVRYFGCKEFETCGFRPEDNKEIVPLVQAPRRRTLRRLDISRN